MNRPLYVGYAPGTRLDLFLRQHIGDPTGRARPGWAVTGPSICSASFPTAMAVPSTRPFTAH
jgi:hypothetical protein